MKLITIGKDNKPRLKKIVDWFIHIVVYALVLILMSVLFNTIYIDSAYYGLYGLLVSLIIYVLNKTVKPILFKLTLPITAITWGLFYPCINIFILKIVDVLLGEHFETDGIITLFLTAVLISFINILIEEIIIKPLLKRSDIKWTVLHYR